MSKIDYYNSLLYGIPDRLLNYIQWIQNYAARVVFRLHNISHITPALATHWLPVNRRVDLKIALMVYKALISQSPAYITNLQQLYDPPWKLRSPDIRWPCILLCGPSCMEQYPSQCEACQDC